MGSELAYRGTSRWPVRNARQAYRPSYGLRASRLSQDAGQPRTLQEYRLPSERSRQLIQGVEQTLRGRSPGFLVQLSPDRVLQLLDVGLSRRFLDLATDDLQMEYDRALRYPGDQSSLVTYARILPLGAQIRPHSGALADGLLGVVLSGSVRPRVTTTSADIHGGFLHRRVDPPEALEYNVAEALLAGAWRGDAELGWVLDKSTPVTDAAVAAAVVHAQTSASPQSSAQAQIHGPLLARDVVEILLPAQLLGTAHGRQVTSAARRRNVAVVTA